MPSLVGEEFLSRPLTVSELTRLVKDELESSFPRVWVQGEITDLRRPQSGHAYFSLKDRGSRVAVVMFRSALVRTRTRLEDGMEVTVRGRLSVYEPRGTYQVIATSVVTVGAGGLEAELRKLVAKLSAEGIFDDDHKKPLPYAPSRIALVTSPSGAAVRDLVSTIHGRFPPAEIAVFAVPVQGAEAAPAIVRALRALDASGAFDVIIVSRGGGSAEDLAPFNDERLARAIYETETPVVSAVGHEIDLVVSDLAADVRARTPTHAGQIVVPDKADVTRRLDECIRACAISLGRSLIEARRRLLSVAKTISPRAILSRRDEAQEDLDDLMANISSSARRTLETKAVRLEAIGKRLESLSPLAVLARGYSVTLDAESGKVIMDSRCAGPGTEIITRLARGRLTSTVSRSDNE